MLASSLLPLLLFPVSSWAYTWKFNTAPQQCADLTVVVSGDDGKPPYSIMIVPAGPTPFSNGVEARRLLNIPFSTDKPNQVTFRLPYPANSQLVAVVSDSTGFGSGGTSVAAQVTTSDTDDCFNSQTPVAGKWTYAIEPQAQIVMCQDVRLFWQPNQVTGTPKFYGIIPGGQSFQVPQGRITDDSNNGFGTGFTWKPSLRAGTSLTLAGGDDAGNSGGSSEFTVANGPKNDISCLNSSSPSSTAGDPAGGTYPTDRNGSTSDGSSNNTPGGNKNNTGAIVGSVVGGVVAILALILILFFLRRRRRHNRAAKEKPDLLTSDEGDERPDRPQELPQYYTPEPFMVPMPTSTDASSEYDRRQSLLTRSDTPDASSVGGMSSATRKGGAPRSLRPVNIVQHDDAGPPPREDDEGAETIELPPAYTNIKKPAGPPPSSFPAGAVTASSTAPTTTAPAVTTAAAPPPA